MKFTSAYMHRDLHDNLVAKAELEVPGLGVVKINHALSKRLMTEIECEVEGALRLKLGQVLDTTNNAARIKEANLMTGVPSGEEDKGS